MKLVNRLKKHYFEKLGYNISNFELKSFYTNGTLILSDSLENELIQYFENNNI
jgi:predicted P-loop ATPase/GTPase